MQALSYYPRLPSNAVLQPHPSWVEGGGGSGLQIWPVSRRKYKWAAINLRGFYFPADETPTANCTNVFFAGAPLVPGYYIIRCFN